MAGKFARKNIRSGVNGLSKHFYFRSFRTEIKLFGPASLKSCQVTGKTYISILINNYIIYINNHNYKNFLINYINLKKYFVNNLWKKLIYFYLSKAQKFYWRQLLSQALNKSCSHYIRKFQVLCLRIVSERVRDSTKAYRTTHKCSY